MARYHSNTKHRFLIFAITLAVIILIYYLTSLRYKLDYLTKYTEKHFHNKFIYTNKFDQLNHFGRGHSQKYILLSSNTELINKYTIPEVKNGQAIILYFYPLIQSTQSKLDQRLLKMTFYGQNFLISTSGFIITKDSVPSTGKTFVSEFVHDSLKPITYRVYSNDAPFFKALGSKSIWLPVANDSLIDKQMRYIERQIIDNKAIVAYYYQSYYKGRVSDKYLLEFFGDTSRFKIIHLQDGFAVLNKKAFSYIEDLNNLKNFLKENSIKSIYTNNIYTFENSGIQAYWLPPGSWNQEKTEQEKVYKMQSIFSMASMRAYDLMETV